MYFVRSLIMIPMFQVFIPYFQKIFIRRGKYFSQISIKISYRVYTLDTFVLYSKK